MRNLPRTVLALAPFLFLVACGPEVSPAVERRECDGVECVVNHRPAWSDGGGLQVGAEAEVRLAGARPDDPESLFGAISGAAFLPDGGWVVAEAAARRLHFFEPTGEWRRSVGRQGEGPGEYIAMRWMDRCWPDRIAVLDRQLLVEVALDGEQLQRRGIIDLMGQRPWFQACDGAGRFVALGIDMASWRGRAGAGLVRPDGEAVILHEPEGERTSLGRFPVGEVHQQLSDAGFHPLARVTQVAIGGGSVWIGTADDWEIRQYDLDGLLLRRFRRPGDPQPLDPDRVRELLDRELETLPPRMREFWRGRLGPDDNPPSLPAYDAFLADSQGRLWVRAYAPAGTGGNDWSVFDQEGRWLGEMTLPGTFEPLDIGPDRLLGMELDELDQPRVSVYRLEPSSR